MTVRDETIAVRGLGPLIRDLSKVSKTAARAVRDEMRSIAAPVAIDIKLREGYERFGARTISGVKVIVRQRGVNVEQTRRRSADVKLRRKNFAPLQMEKAFLPGLEDNEEAIVRRTTDFISTFLGESVGRSLT